MPDAVAAGIYAGGMRSHPFVRPGERASVRRSVALLGAVAFLVSGCTAEPAPALSALPPLSATVAPPGGGGSVSPSPSTAPPRCDDGVLTLAGVDEEFIVTGSCRRVEVAGTGLDIDLTGVEVSTVRIRGDGNEIEARTLQAVTIEGQDNELDLRSVGRAAVRGDRNSWDVAGDIGDLVIVGNDNEVEAADIGSADVTGDRNEVLPG